MPTSAQLELKEHTELNALNTGKSDQLSGACVHSGHLGTLVQKQRHTWIATTPKRKMSGCENRNSNEHVKDFRCL